MRLTLGSHDSGGRSRRTNESKVKLICTASSKLTVTTKICLNEKGAHLLTAGKS